MQAQRATDTERDDVIATLLSRSEAYQKVFLAIYSGGRKPKSAEDLAHKTKLSKIRVLQIATMLSNRTYAGLVKVNGQNFYSKIPDLINRRDKLLRLARNKKRLKAEVMNRRGVQVHVKVSAPKARPAIPVEFIGIDKISNFAKARRVTRQMASRLRPTRLPEKQFKYGVARILGENGTFTDWGGEKNDLYATDVRIGAKTYRTAFAFKGPATSPPLTIKKLGKNANQIPKLFTSPAEVFFIQFEGQISEDVIEQMETYAFRKSRELAKKIFYGVIAAEDSARLRAAYKKQFSVPISRAQ